MGSCMNGNINDYNRVKGMRIQIGMHVLIIQQKIAGGSFGDVWRCKQLGTGAIYAVKQIKTQSQQLQQMFNKQVKWLQKLIDVNGVINYVGSKKIHEGNRNKSTGIIVTEYCSSTLFDYIKNRILSSYQILHILQQICNTLAEIHRLGCLHLDVKLQNILCKQLSSGEIGCYLCDFGSCKQGPINVQLMDRKQKIQLNQYIQSCSTLIYRAPQMIQPRNGEINGKADIWMVGCIAYLLLFRKHPFQGQGPLGILTADINYNEIPQISDELEHSAKNVEKIIKSIKGMLQLKNSQRLDQQQILHILNS